MHIGQDTVGPTTFAVDHMHSYLNATAGGHKYATRLLIPDRNAGYYGELSGDAG